jgi:enamine deaminase RidA (YjgF/YER057c/UK114 family)
MTGRIVARLEELGIELPQPATPVANYVPFVRSGHAVFIAGQLPRRGLERPFVGKLGRDLGIEEGRAAARLCALQVVAHLSAALQGDLDRVARCVRLGGFVNSAPEFEGQPAVLDGASDLIVQIFGDAGRHARTAVGVNALPYDVAVEIDALFEVR